jgi:hypothetical protein
MPSVAQGLDQIVDPKVLRPEVMSDYPDAQCAQIIDAPGLA